MSKTYRYFYFLSPFFLQWRGGRSRTQWWKESTYEYRGLINRLPRHLMVLCLFSLALAEKSERIMGRADALLRECIVSVGPWTARAGACGDRYGPAWRGRAVSCALGPATPRLGHHRDRRDLLRLRPLGHGAANRSLWMIRTHHSETDSVSTHHRFTTPPK